MIIIIVLSAGIWYYHGSYAVTLASLQDKTKSYETLSSSYSSLKTDYQSLKSIDDKLSEDFSKLLGKFNKASEVLNDLKMNYEKLNNLYIDQQVEYQKLQEQYRFAQEVPYTVISDRTVNWVWQTSQGRIENWTMPIDTYKYYVGQTGTRNTLYLQNTNNGQTYQVIDYRPFVQASMFNKVIPDFYNQMGNDEKFIHECWFLITQLTTYAANFDVVPAWPVETLTEAGGDCKDTSVLLASMLKAAPAGYKVSLIYLDINNPTKPMAMNHMIVYVEYGQYTHLIETTSKTVMEPYTSGASGWIYEIN
jgi:hypothetical protein